MEQIIATIREFIPIIVAAIPGIIALITQRRRNEAESKKTKEINKADAADKIGDATIKIQDIYQELIEDIKEQTTICKTKLDEVICEIEKIKLVNESVVLTNKILSDEIEAQRLRIKGLEEKVSKLIEQVKSLGETPVVTLNNNKEH